MFVWRNCCMIKSLGTNVLTLLCRRRACAVCKISGRSFRWLASFYDRRLLMNAHHFTRMHLAASSYTSDYYWLSAAHFFICADYCRFMVLFTVKPHFCFMNGIISDRRNTLIFDWCWYFLALRLTVLSFLFIFLYSRLRHVFFAHTIITVFLIALVS